MSVAIEGLEFQIESDSDKAAKGIDALVESFEKLKIRSHQTNPEKGTKPSHNQPGFVPFSPIYR